MIENKFIDRLKKIKQLTSKWGIYQHGELDKLNPEFGYAIEDQARALLVAEAFGEENLTNIYFEFMINALDKNGKIYQYFYDKENGIKPDMTKECSEDGLGMVAWALLESKITNQKKDIILNIILERAKDWKYLRSMAYLILGLTESEEDELEDRLVNKLLKSFKEEGDWRWFENKLTYGNAAIPWALWKRGRVRNDEKSLEIAKKATNFLLEKYMKNGVPQPIAVNGLDKNEKKRQDYDQQPIEAGYMVMCLEEAYKATNDNYYKDMAEKWWGWFWGNNIKKVKLIDDDFACYDGLTAKDDKVNLNQGAESNICFLMAYLAVRRLGLAD